MTGPTRKDRSRPAELLGLSAGLAVFAGIITLISTRAIDIAVVTLGVTFIISLVVLATLSITGRPDDAEILDLDDQDREGH